MIQIAWSVFPFFLVITCLLCVAFPLSQRDECQQGTFNTAAKEPCITLSKGPFSCQHYHGVFHGDHLLPSCNQLRSFPRLKYSVHFKEEILPPLK